jgi:hypothetical protein
VLDTPAQTFVVRADGSMPVAGAAWRQRVTVEGRIRSVQVGSTAGCSLEVQVFDESGGLRLLFFGRKYIAGIEPGAWIRASGRVGKYKEHLAIANPTYELLAVGVAAASPD